MSCQPITRRRVEMSRSVISQGGPWCTRRVERWNHRWNISWNRWTNSKRQRTFSWSNLQATSEQNCCHLFHWRFGREENRNFPIAQENVSLDWATCARMRTLFSDHEKDERFACYNVHVYIWLKMSAKRIVGQMWVERHFSSTLCILYLNLFL